MRRRRYWYVVVLWSIRILCLRRIKRGILNNSSLLSLWVRSFVFHNSFHWNWDTIFGVCKCNFTMGFFFYRDRTYLVNNGHIDLDDGFWTHCLWRINLLYLSMFVQQILPMKVNVLTRG